jgi:hypothetical protein
LNFNADLFAFLPAKSADKLARLLDQREAAHEAVLAAGERYRDAHEDFRRLIRHGMAIDEQRGIRAARETYFPGAADEIDPANRELVAAKGRVDRAAAARDAATAAWERFEFLTRATDWLSIWAGHGGKLVYRDLPEVRLANGDTHKEAVARVRDQIAAVDIEWARIEAAPRTLAALKAEIVAQVDKIAQTGRPRFLNRDAPLPPNDLESTIKAPRVLSRDPTNLAEVLRLQMSGGRMMYDLPTPFIFWLDRDRIIERLCAEAAKLDFSDAMDDGAREGAFSRLLDQRLQLSWQEEALIESAAEDDITITRRADCDPRAVLQIVESSGSGGVEESERPARRRAPAHNAGVAS